MSVYELAGCYASPRRPFSLPTCRPLRQRHLPAASARMEQDRDSWNDIDGITLPVMEEKQEMHLQTLLQQTIVAEAAVAAQSFAVPTARVAAGHG